MKKYIYKGSIRSTACGVYLHPNKEVELLETDSRVRSLIAQGLLDEVKTTKKKESKDGN